MTIRCLFHDQSDGQAFHRAYLPYKNIHKPLESKGIKLFLQTGINNINEFDAFILSRCPHPSFMPELEMIKRMKKTLIWEIDDDLWNLPEHNPASKTFTPDALQRVNWMKDNADHIIVSTDYLKKVVDRPNTVVLPNLLDLSLWHHPRHEHKGTRIVFQGSAFHQKDVEMIVPVVEEIIKLPDVIFIFFGDIPESMCDWVKIWGQPYAQAIPHSRYNGKVGFVNPVAIQNFPETLCAISPDIGICPLTNEPFNYSKSNLKFLEYTAAGAITLAQDLPPYQDSKGCMLTNDWLKDLTNLLTYPNLDILENVKREVSENYSWQKQKQVWINSFVKMLG